MDYNSGRHLAECRPLGRVWGSCQLAPCDPYMRTTCHIKKVDYALVNSVVADQEKPAEWVVTGSLQHKIHDPDLRVCGGYMLYLTGPVPLDLWGDKAALLQVHNGIFEEHLGKPW